MKKEHLYFVPKNKLAVTLPADPDDADKSIMRVFIPLSVDKSTVGVRAEYNYVLDNRILIVNFTATGDFRGDNNNIEFLCLKVINIYTNKGPKMIVVKTTTRQDDTPPLDVSLSKYPEWESPVLTYSFVNNQIVDSNGEVDKNPKLTLNSRGSDSCTIPPGGGD